MGVHGNLGVFFFDVVHIDHTSLVTGENVNTVGDADEIESGQPFSGEINGIITEIVKPRGKIQSEDINDHTGSGFEAYARATRRRIHLAKDTI